jgi:transcriptional regulator with XRE-family HTH domain
VTGRGELCAQVVSDANDHCEAGHSNKIRTESTVEFKTPGGNDLGDETTSFEIDEISGTGPDKVGDQIKTTRERKCFSRELLAKCTGISEGKLSEIEDGTAEIEVTEAALIAAALDLSLSELLGKGLSPQLRLTEEEGNSLTTPRDDATRQGRNGNPPKTVNFAIGDRDILAAELELVTELAIGFADERVDHVEVRVDRDNLELLRFALDTLVVIRPNDNPTHSGGQQS